MSDDYNRAQLEELQRISDKLDAIASNTRPVPALTVRDIIGAVALGLVMGWFLIWLGAQALPEAIYWPIKVVVEGS